MGVRRRRAGPRNEHRRDAGHEDEDRDRDEHRGRPDHVGDRADDDDRHEARDRDEHVQDAEDAAADVLRQVLLELGLRRDRDEAVGDAGEQRDDDDDRQQRGDARQVEAARRVGALEEPADRARDREQRQQHARGAMRPPSMTRRRGR